MSTVQGACTHRNTVIYRQLNLHNKLLHYNIPASRGPLYCKLLYIVRCDLYITTIAPVEGLYITSYFTCITFTTHKGDINNHLNIYTLLFKLLSQFIIFWTAIGTFHPFYMFRMITHYNEEIPLRTKLGQVSAMLSITSYVKDSLSKLSSTQYSEVQISILLIALWELNSL